MKKSTFVGVKNWNANKSTLLNMYSRIISVFLLIAGFVFSVTASENELNGEIVYIQNCQVCHGDDGHGAMPGAPDLIEKSSWEKQSDSKLLSRLKNGIQTPGAIMAMPPKGGNPNLTDRELKASIQYIRNTLMK